MTQKQFKAEQERLRRAILEAWSAWTEDRQWQRLQERADARKRGLKAICEEKAKALQIQLETLERDYRITRNEGRMSPTGELQEFWKRVTSGVDYGRPINKWRVEWQRPQGRLYLFTIPPGSYWAGLGRPRGYTRARHYLVDLHRATGKSGLKAMNDATLMEAEGRLTKEQRAKFLNFAQNYIQ